MTSRSPGPERVGGTREDPHAQARAARELPVLLHSLSLFREVFAALYAVHKIDTVVEVGVESGEVTGMYVELGASAVYAVDPFCPDEVRERLAADDAVHLVERPSPEALADLPVADLYVLDGDHNHAVVHAEMTWILENAPDAVTVVHDVLWPCGRRDQYYTPSPLPPQRRHLAGPEGATVWHDEVTPAGFVGLGAFTTAVEAGGERNGVLTAVEDALREHADDGWDLRIVPAIFGLGLVSRADRDDVAEALLPWTGSHLLATMENNRVALYTRVLDLQYQAVAAAGHVAALAEAVASREAELRAREERIVRLEEAVRHERTRDEAPPPPPPPGRMARLRAAAGRTRPGRVVRAALGRA